MSFEKIVHCLSATDQKVIAGMMALYDEIDRQTANFAGQTGLKCKNGCGSCCTNPDIETTVAEILPLAVYLWSQNLAQSKLESIQSRSSKGVCVFYQPDPVTQTHGRCGIYAYRPGLCRLFGFAARKNKYGQNLLVTCKIIKDSQARACERVEEKLQEGLQAPSLNTHAFQVSNIDPVHGRELLPINQAISRGIEKIGFNIDKQ